MPKTIKNHELVEVGYLEEAGGPHVRHPMPFERHVVWNALLDPVAWTEWLPITKVTWTSPKPFGVGTTRTVEIKDNIVDETFLIWEEGSRMAFRFDRSGFPVTAGVEDYHVVDAPGGSEMLYSCRMSPTFPKGFMLNQQMRFGFRFMLPKLEKLIAKDPARFGG